MNAPVRLLLLLIFLFFPLWVFAAEGPRMVVEDGDFTFGQVYAGMKVEHTFRFTNAGGEPLHIDRVRSSCGCTAALLSSSLLAPGEIGEIKTTFDSTRFQGPVVKTIYLYSNDPQQKVTQLYIRGTVQEEIGREPDRINFKTLSPGTTSESRITLVNRGTGELFLTGIQVTAGEMQAELASSRLAPGESTDLIVRATPKVGQTRLSGYVIISTSSPYMPELRIPAFGTVTVPAPGS